jgi:serine/threonine protein kinase/CheY-like chemotaxis protein
MSSKGRLLVVDDNEMNRDTMSRQLERAGYEVATAEEGIKALEMIDAQSFDLVLLDVMMPGLTGIELLKIVRADRPANELPIIMATARDKSENMVEALSLGANDYVTKPLDFPVVLARIEAHLKMKHAAAAAKAAVPVQTSAVIEPGAVLAGKYRLESKIGSGAFGAVFKATHLQLANKVAVKVLQSNMVPTQEALARFQREGVSACRIQHPNAVSILDFGVTDKGVAYLAMELLQGHSLAEEIQKRAPFSPRRCAEILAPLCDVLSEAHAANIIHRDIKPANVFLHHGRAGEVVKVLDFGIAKLLDDGGTELTVEGSLVGTPAYMAPERLSSQPYDGRSDVYSVGILLYEMLCGQPPFKSKDLMAVAMMQMTQEPRPARELNSSIPPAVEAVVMETLSKDPGRRPTPAALAERFTSAANAAAASSAADDTLNFKTPPTVQPSRMAVPAAASGTQSAGPSAAPSASRPAATRQAAPPRPTVKPAVEPEEGSLFGRIRRKLFGG